SSCSITWSNASPAWIFAIPPHRPATCLERLREGESDVPVLTCVAEEDARHAPRFRPTTGRGDAGTSTAPTEDAPSDRRLATCRRVGPRADGKEACAEPLAHPLRDARTRALAARAPPRAPAGRGRPPDLCRARRRHAGHAGQHPRPEQLDRSHQRRVRDEAVVGPGEETPDGQPRAEVLELQR